LTRIYEWLFLTLRRNIDLIFSSTFVAPELTIVYTPIALSEAVLLDDHRHLLYDQYLGNILSRLNKLILEDAPPEMVDAYLYKLFALRHLAAGRLEQALECALRHFQLERDLPQEPASEEPAEMRGRRFEQTILQEHFVLAHELAHELHRQDRTIALRWGEHYVDQVATEARVRDEHWATSDHSREIAESMAGDWDHALIRRFGPPPEGEDMHRQHLSTWTEEQATAVRQTRDRSRLRMVDRIREDPVLLEECICDSIATQLTAIFASSWRIPFSVSIPACFVALRHLRMIQHIDSWMEKGEDLPEVELRNFMEQTQTRVVFFRLVVHAWLMRIMSDGGLEVANDIEQRLNSGIDAQNHVIGDQVSLHMVRLYDMWVEEPRVKVVNEMVRSGNDLKPLIKLLCQLD